MLNEQTLEWLLENGGPAIRYRTAIELLDDPTGVDLDELTAALLESPVVNGWLERLIPGTGFNQLHGSKPTTYESAMGKLTQLGCRRGMPPFDERVRPFRDWLAQTMRDAQDWSWMAFQRAMVGGFVEKPAQDLEAGGRRLLSLGEERAQQGRRIGRDPEADPRAPLGREPGPPPPPRHRNDRARDRPA